jgi:hypothetical protein
MEQEEGVSEMDNAALNECREDGGDHFLCGCITQHVREIMQHWTGTNCTWSDDDVTVLGILAGHAIRAGLHHEAKIPATMVRCIDEHLAINPRKPPAQE